MNIRATVVKVCVLKNGTMRIIKDPIPGVKLGIKSISNHLALVVEECEEDTYLIDVVGLDGPIQLDAITRECLRSYRADTGILVNPLRTIYGRKPLEIPESVHSIFWAYHK